MTYPDPQVFGPVMTLEALPPYTREALARALASWKEARRQAFGSPVYAEDLSGVHGAREALEEALWILGPLELPGAVPGSNRSFFPSVFRPGDHLLICHSWALEQALNQHQEALWNP